MTQIARRAEISLQIEAVGEVLISDLATQCSVSEMTIRRDLDTLVEQGRAIRTHGGATASGRVSFEFSFLKKRREKQREKDEIGSRASSLVNDGQIVALDSGTTTLAVARALRGRTGITVVTTSLPIASELQYQPNIRILLLGGLLRSGSPDLSGGLTERNLDELRVDVAILGADAIDVDGAAYSNSVDVAHLLTRMAAAAKQVYVVADHSKLGAQGLMRYGTVQAWNGLITDSLADPKLIDALTSSGVNVIRK